MTRPNLKFGIFLAPFHGLKEDPTQALERDLQLVSYLDDLGYDYAWIGEHHSGGVEIIASPEVFIAQAATQTKHIRFGAGVSSLTFHHPLILADRIMQLDHMTPRPRRIRHGPGCTPLGWPDDGNRYPEAKRQDAPGHRGFGSSFTWRNGYPKD